MPVTAKLSRKFYEKLGDDVATELVEWFNQVDATYRTELRELNEASFARFDAKLANLRADLLKWMFVYWVGSAVTTAGLILSVVGLLRR